jgi:hypothetical protein
MSVRGDERATGLPREQAVAIFERLRSLEGNWRGTSTRGWDNEMQVQVIAAGSTILNVSKHAHPGEQMATTFTMDGDALLLTHYCVAKNQPRLVASIVEDGGRRVTFTYRDGGNLPTRDRGHMDKVVYQFDTDDRFVSRWTWYQDGQERWLEEVEYVRAR